MLIVAAPAAVAAQTQVFVVDSPSYVRQIVTTAHALARGRAAVTFTVRTTEQVLEADEATLRPMVSAAHIIVLGRVYGDVADKLRRVLATEDLTGKTVFAVFSDFAVMRLTTIGNRPIFDGISDDTLRAIADSLGGEDAGAALVGWQLREPRLAPWIHGLGYVVAKGPVNFQHLFAYLLASGAGIGQAPAASVEPMPPYFAYREGRVYRDVEEFAVAAGPERPAVAILDYDSYFHSGDVQLLEAVAAALRAKGFVPLPIIAGWGEPTYLGLKEFLLDQRHRIQLAAIVSLQSFVLGGDQARDKVSAAIAELGVPVFRAIRLPKRAPDVWRTSEDGLPWSSVYYQVAMPELQGVIEPILVGAEREQVIDAVTGARLSVFEPIAERIDKLARRVQRWYALQTLQNSKKRVAIIYYNHPPGKQNIGADYLNVPATLLQLLDILASEGYQTGEYPRDQEALLDVLMTRGINVANWAPGLQRELAREAFSVPAADYVRWFRTLPPIAQAEVRDGPAGYVRELVELARGAEDKTEATNTVERYISELKGFIESFAGDQTRTLELADQLRERLTSRLLTDTAQATAAASETQPLIAELQALGLEGLSGWGAEPGAILVSNEGRDVVIPGVQYGNVFLGPQPQRGWQADADALHSSTIVPPHHQYLAFYYYVHEVFRADVIIHVGRHSSYEWLPRKHVALAEFDFPDIVIGDAPAVYLYTVDGVGEGLQAKRRGLSVIVDHLIPPLKTTELYATVLELQQLVEQYEAQDVPERRAAIARALRETISRHHFTSDLGEDVLSYDADTLVHTVGHYLEELKTTFLPYGLHTFAKPWDSEKVDVLADSMARMHPDQSLARTEENRALIEASFSAERESLLDALAGRYVIPGKGNDPIRTPEALPTGRNFFAIDASVMPTRISYELARGLVAEAIGLRDPVPEKMSAILWAVETVRDEGTMLSFVLQMLGVRPEWDARGLVKDLRAVPLEELGHPRIDVVVTTSGLFRDLFGQLTMLLDKAFRVALASSYEAILRERPDLAGELDQVLAPLQTPEAYRGDDPLSHNYVARHWVAQLANTPSVGGELALARIFGPAEGAYGAGISHVIEQAWTWEHRTQISDVYIQRMSHVYTARTWGVSQSSLYREALSGVDLSFHSRATNLYGVVDNDDYFDYFGGLSMAIEKINGRVPGNYVLFHADPERSRIEPLERFLTREMRTRYFNPEWITGMMAEGYSGARTMSNKFVEFTWGWQVTNPDIIRDWMWDEVVDVYVRDKHNLGVSRWLSERQHAPALMNMTAVLLTAADKGFWRTSPDTLAELATRMGELVTRYGPACSAHVCGNADTERFAAQFMRPDLRARFTAVMAAATSRVYAGSGAATVARSVQRARTSRAGAATAGPAYTVPSAPLLDSAAVFVSLPGVEMVEIEHVSIFGFFAVLTVIFGCAHSVVRQRRSQRVSPTVLRLR